LIDRRTLLEAMALLALSPALAVRARAEKPDAALASALEASPFVYVSPLRRNGTESRCHGEVWFGWIDGAVVLTTAVETWKARSVASGLTLARIWVGDHGRWKQMIGKSEAFRAAPSFTARAAISKDPALLEKLLAIYDKKYPAEIGRWRDRMRAGQKDGSRVVIRYVPEPPPAPTRGAART
jgi:hypothetical protein